MEFGFEKNDLRIVAVEREGFRGFPMLFHTHMEILSVLQGEISVCVDGIRRTLRPGELCAVFPYVLHSYEDAPNSSFRLLMASPSCLPDFSKILLESKPILPFFELDETLSFLTAKAAACMYSDDPLKPCTACGYTAALVGELLHRCQLTREYSTQNKTIHTILTYCREHASENISIRSVSAACFVSESYVSKLFARKIGMPFRAYLNDLRVAKAKHLLETTELGMSDIMEQCGFYNQSSFNRVFLELCGKTPRQYRSDTALPTL